jgi:hypothetical protein
LHPSKKRKPCSGEAIQIGPNATASTGFSARDAQPRRLVTTLSSEPGHLQKDPATVAGPNHDDRYRGYRKEWTTSTSNFSASMAPSASAIMQSADTIA